MRNKSNTSDRLVWLVAPITAFTISSLGCLAQQTNQNGPKDQLSKQTADAAESMESYSVPKGSFDPAVDLNIVPTGGLPGTGGYVNTIPKVHSDHQSHEWGQRPQLSKMEKNEEAVSLIRDHKSGERITPRWPFAPNISVAKEGYPTRIFNTGPQWIDSKIRNFQWSDCLPQTALLKLVSTRQSTLRRNPP